MVEAFKYLAERPFADSFLDFKSVGDVIFFITNVLSFIIVEPPVFWAVRRCQKMFSWRSLADIDIVDLIEFKNL